MSSGLKIDSKKIMKEIEKKPDILLKQNAGKTLMPYTQLTARKGY